MPQADLPAVAALQALQAGPPLAETYKNTGPYFAAISRPPASLCEALWAGQRMTEQSEVTLELGLCHRYDQPSAETNSTG